MTLTQPLSERNRANLRIQVHRHALLLTGALEALPPPQAAAASASLRQMAVVLETLADDHRLALAALQHQQQVQARRSLVVSLCALGLALLALLV